ncbi:hypothetical protein BASA61_005152, partial [Batrachochytrium salamandrivorans]
MPFPVRVRKLKLKSYGENCDAEQYNAFIASEIKYFESKYFSGEILAKDDFGTPFIATRKSDGMKVAYKSIPKSEVYEYALESSPSPICHLRNHLVCSKKQSVEQCISPRQLNLFLPYELMLQTYLSRPGYDNPYVPMTFDHYILADAFILVMEYFGENWVDLSKYVDEKGPLDINEACNIVKEVVNGMIYLKQYGIVHNDLYEDCYSAHPFAHLVVECEQVVGHRIQSGLVPAIQKSRLRPLSRALDPDVENVYTWLSGGVLNGEADLDQQWLDGTVEHEYMGTRHDNRAPAARLADFLHVAYRQYQSTLWQIPPGIALWKL